MYPKLRRNWSLRMYTGGITLINLLTSGGMPLSAAEAFYISGCDGQTEGEAIARETARLFTGEEIDLSKFSAALVYGDVPADRPSAKLAAFERQLALSNEPWPYYALREKSILQASFTLTRMCNHLCTYCFQGEGHWEDDRAPVSMWTDALGQLCDMGLTELNITGGEAALHPAFWPLMEQANERELHVKLQTNGTLFEPGDVKRLTDLGLGYLYFSLPSLNDDTYDRVTRSKGDLPRAMNALREFKKHGVFARVKSVITPYNVSEDDLRDICAFCYDLGVEELHLAPYMMTVKGGNTMIPAKKDLDRLSRFAEELHALYENKMMVAYPGYGLYKWTEGEKVSRCGGVKDSLTILPDGSVTFCEMLCLAGLYNFGNVQTTKIRDLWYSDVPDAANEPENVDPRCRACARYEECHTGCLLFAYLDSGNPWGMDPCCYKSDSTLFQSAWDKREG